MGLAPLTAAFVSALACTCAVAQVPPPAATARAAELPVKEVTVFKDGHAFVLRENALLVGPSAEVVLDDLPAPVLGTFWPYAEGGARVASAKAAKQRVAVERTALDVRQLVEANVGAEVALIDVEGARVEGRILSVPVRSADELDAAAPRERHLAQKGSIVLVATAEGTRAVPLERVREVVLKGEARPKVTDEEWRDRLTLSLAFDESAARDRARVGVVYLQKGLRWIPAYKVDIDGDGKAKVELEATLVNDLIDLDDATVHLVIGVPRFEFAGQVDPISLQQIAADVAQQLQGRDRFSGFLSNAIMSQSAAYSVMPDAEAAAPEPEVVGGEANEDLFVFTVRHVTLKKGERAVMPIASYALTYRDVYVLDVPFAPPLELRDQFQADRMAELARILAAPKAMHVLRVHNDAAQPLTTAPALLLSGGKVLAQSLMTYTPPGAESDLPLTVAVEIAVEKTEKESARKPDAVRWGGNDYYRIDMEGAVALTNRKREPVELEVRRHVLGLADSATADGTFEQKSLAEAWFSTDRPGWWSWWTWPYWWHHWNGVARFTWKLELAPGAKATLDARWHYFWR
jgi:hypothetical protein